MIQRPPSDEDQVYNQLKPREAKEVLRSVVKGQQD